MKPLASIRPILRALSRFRRLPLQYARARDYGMGLVLGTYVSMAHASILAPKVCGIFKQVAGNDLYSIAAGIGGAGLLVANSMNEGDNKVKTATLRIGIAGAALVNLENLSTLVTGSPWGC